LHQRVQKHLDQDLPPIQCHGGGTRKEGKSKRARGNRNLPALRIGSSPETRKNAHEYYKKKTNRVNGKDKRIFISEGKVRKEKEIQKERTH